MTRALTAKSVETAKPDPEKRIEIRDGALIGLRLQVQPTGRKSWLLRYTHEGRYRKLTLGRYPAMSLLEAREEARARLREVEHGRDPAAAEKAEKARARDDKREGRNKLANLVEEYGRKHLLKKRSGEHSMRYLRVELVRELGDRDIQEVTKRDLVDLFDAIVERGSPVTANRTFAHTRAMFNWARGRGVIDQSPLDGMKLPAPETSRDRVLSEHELRLFWQATEALEYPFGPLYRLLLLTGQRLREVAHMRASEVDGDLWTIPGARAKNGDPHGVPLSPLARSILDDLPRVGVCPYLFTTNGETPVSGFTKGKARLDREMARIAEAEAGEPVELERFVIHDLRRTAASGMAELRIPPHVTEAVLNHRSGTVSGIARVYNRHDYADEKREALEAWANRVRSIVEGDQGNVIQLEARP